MQVLFAIAVTGFRQNVAADVNRWSVLFLITGLDPGLHYVGSYPADGK